MGGVLVESVALVFTGSRRIARISLASDHHSATESHRFGSVTPVWGFLESPSNDQFDFGETRHSSRLTAVSFRPCLQ